MKSVADLLARLEALRDHTNDTPLFNPAFQLSLELSREIEAGELTLDTVESMIAELECEALQSRAGRLRRLVEPVDPQANLAGFAERLAAEPDGFLGVQHPLGTSAAPLRVHRPSDLPALPGARPPPWPGQRRSEAAIDAAACAAPGERPQHHPRLRA